MAVNSTLYEYPKKTQKAFMMLVLINEYENHLAGWLKSIIDDGNLTNYHIGYSIEVCQENNDYMAETILKLLIEFTEEEREYLLNDLYETDIAEIDFEFNKDNGDES